MNFLLRVWRQKDAKAKGKLVDYKATDISPNTSFLEMLDIVNEGLVTRGEEPIAFDSDCREGICGTCSLTINGEAHGPDHPALPAKFTCGVLRMERRLSWSLSG
jgi:succinate dehydrogenase / fumarate reductase iron-sulfur subunit